MDAPPCPRIPEAAANGIWTIYGRNCKNRAVLLCVACGSRPLSLQWGERWSPYVEQKLSKPFRKSKGLSQQELAVKVNVVRQTISKMGARPVRPDSDLLIALSEP